MNRGKLIDIAYIISFSFMLGFGIVQKLMKRGKVVGTFHHAITEEDEEYPSRICFKYEVDGKEYYFNTDNVLKEKEFNENGPKIKLIYDIKDPSKAALDDGWIGLILQVLLLVVFIVIAKLFTL